MLVGAALRGRPLRYRSKRFLIADEGAPTERRPYEFVCLLGLGFCICVSLVAIHIRIRVCSNLELVLYALNAFDRFDSLVSLSHLGLTCNSAGKGDDAVVALINTSLVNLGAATTEATDES